MDVVGRATGGEANPGGARRRVQARSEDTVSLASDAQYEYEFHSKTDTIIRDEEAGRGV